MAGQRERAGGLMPELLLELFSEEIPARMQARAADDLRRLFEERLKAASLSFERIRAFVTPRRLTLVVDGLPLKQPDIREEKKGPRVGAPEPAIQGFLKSLGLSGLDQCEKRTVGKAEFWFAVTNRNGMPTADVIRLLLPPTIWNLSWPKSMRWGSSRLTWVRPLSRVLCLFEGQTVNVQIQPSTSDDVASFDDLLNLDLVDDNKRHELPVTDRTTGHRFMSGGEIAVTGFADYARKLRERFVIVDQDERRETIRKKTDEAARAEG
ncbi:MAG TPA: glycine--tRNA ligase subunit beta, partial [Alphaproteobacteria bacterium]|nr:glycine--tRNA ligase subunit beta [Alphaproteobacteria bacterium]